MAFAAGNSNQPSATGAARFDIQNLFRPPNPNPNGLPNFAPPSHYQAQPQPPPSSSTAYSYPPPTSPFHHQVQHPFLNYPQDPQNPRPPVSSFPVSSTPYNANPSPSPNHGAAGLMALLGTAPPSSNLESAASMPHQSWIPPPTSSSTPPSASSLPEFPLLPNPSIFPSAPPVNMIAGGGPQQAPARLPRGRALPGGDRAVYDVDTRLPGELQPPQLEVTPITKYLSDPGLVLGRQIAVNGMYICYGLKQGTIRVLNINTALRSLLRGHTQRVTDMTFFAEDVPLLASASIEGRIFVWKINEGPDEENKPQITGKVIVALQIVGEKNSYHPRVCWHPHKQEVLVVGIGNYVLKIETTKVGKGEELEEPVRFSLDKLIDGVQVIGRHDAEVTDLSMCQWMTTRLVSASKDGTVKIWGDQKVIPLATLRPHDGQPVNCSAFLTSPQRPDHIILITAGPLNREVKIWSYASEDGLLLLPGDSESWQCTQTLDLRSSSVPQLEDAFFNQVVVLPQASLILLANAKKNTIYAVHVDYGPYPVATRMDYIADFTVTMPILSVTGTSESLVNGEQVVQVYCVQTQAIQQYALYLSRCLPPAIDNVAERDPCLPHDVEVPTLPIICDLPMGSPSSKHSNPPSSSECLPSAKYPARSGSLEGTRIHDLPTSTTESKPSSPPLPSSDADITCLNQDLSGTLAGLRGSSRDLEQGNTNGDIDVDSQVREYSALVADIPTVPSSVDDNSRMEQLNCGASAISKMQNSNMMFLPHGNTTHLITPSEILSGATSSSESSLVSHGLQSDVRKVQDMIVHNEGGSPEVEVKVVGESESAKDEFDPQRAPQVSKGNMESSLSSRTSMPIIEMDKECCAVETEAYTVKKTCSIDNYVDASNESVNPQEEVESRRVPEKSASASISQPLGERGKKQKPEDFQGSAASSPSSSHSTDYGETERNFLCTDAAFSQILTMQEMLNQLVITQKEMQKQMSTIVTAPIMKEGKRVEAALGRSMEKAVKSNMDALWARFQEDNARQKVERDHIQQITSLVTNYVNKDLPAMLERAIKKEISALGPVVSRAVTPIIEKTISSAIVDSFQRGVGDKAVNQLEKSLNSKLDASLTRQIQAQFQTSAKQSLQDGLRSSLESAAIPAFEKACNMMFEKVHDTFQKGMNEHVTAALQQIESAHTPLALTLRDSISSASSITQNLASELVEGQRKLLALATAGNTKALNPMAIQESNASTGLLHVKLEEPLDPRKELTRLISENKFEQAFTLALQRSDVLIVSWLCSQVDLHEICTTQPLPLSQGVLLSLLQQLACDISNDTLRKDGWMRDIAVVINPTDPMITPHVRPIFEQVYSRLLQQRSIPTTTASEAMGIQVTMHIINSLLTSCK